MISRHDGRIPQTTTAGRKIGPHRLLVDCDGAPDAVGVRSARIDAAELAVMQAALEWRVAEGAPSGVAADPRVFELSDSTPRLEAGRLVWAADGEPVQEELLGRQGIDSCMDPAPCAARSTNRISVSRPIMHGEGGATIFLVDLWTEHPAFWGEEVYRLRLAQTGKRWSVVEDKLWMTSHVIPPSDRRDTVRNP